MQTFCDLPFTKVKLAPDGGLSNCCQQTNGTLGNIFNNTFDEIWFGAIQDNIRKTTSNGVLHELCSKYQCPYKFQNQLEMYEVVNEGYPNQLEIDIPDSQCNIGGEDPKKSGGACVMCRRNSPDWVPEVDKLYDALERIKFIVPHLHTIHVQGIAEPFFKDHIFRILEVIEFEKYKDRILLSTLTNGTYLSKKNRTKFLSMCPISKLGISVDAASSETYRKIRKNGGFNTIKDNIKLYTSERNKSTQYVQITNNINLINLHETVEMVEMAKEVGVDAIEMWPTSYTQENCNDIMVNENNWIEFDEAETKARNRASELAIDFRTYSPLSANFKKELVQIKFI